MSQEKVEATLVSGPGINIVILGEYKSNIVKEIVQFLATRSGNEREDYTATPAQINININQNYVKDGLVTSLI